MFVAGAATTTTATKIVVTSGTTLSGHTAGGSGSVGSPVEVQSGGTVAPGESPGVLKVDDIEFLAGSSLEVEIGGTSAGNTATSHDQVVAAGTVTIDSSAGLDLSVASGSGYVPAPGDSIVIIDKQSSGAISGTFSGAPEGHVITDFFGSGLNAVLSYVGGNGNDLTLHVGGASIDPSGNLVLTGQNADDFTLTYDPTADEFVLTSASASIYTNIASASGSGTTEVRVPTSLVTGSRIIVNGGTGDDVLTVDYSGGAFGKTIEFNGGETGETDGDALYVRGDDGVTVESGVYTPDAATPGKGIHTLTLTVAAGGGTETIEFDELEPTEVSAIPSYTLTTSGSVDVLDVAATLASGGEDALIVTGTSDGVAIESLTIFDVTSFTIDTATNDAAGGGTGNDSITLTSGLDNGTDLARNLVNFAIDAGAGGTGDADTMTLNAIVDVPGSVTIDKGDTVDVNSDIEAGTSLTISNVDTEIDLAQNVDLTAGNGDLSLESGVTLIDLSGAGGTNRFIANDTDSSGDGNISLGPVSDSGTPMALEVDADNAASIDSITVQSTISIFANQDFTGAQGFSQASGTSITTTDDTASAVSITVNSLMGGTGGAALGTISAGTTAGSSGG